MVVGPEHFPPANPDCGYRAANASGGSENGSSVNFDPTNVGYRQDEARPALHHDLLPWMEFEILPQPTSAVEEIYLSAISYRPSEGKRCASPGAISSCAQYVRVEYPPSGGRASFDQHICMRTVKRLAVETDRHRENGLIS